MFFFGGVFLLSGEAKIERMLGASRDELRIKLEKNQLESEDSNDLRGLASNKCHIFDMRHNLRVVESGFWMQGSLSKDVETLSTHFKTQTAVRDIQLEISTLFDRKFDDLLLLAYEILSCKSLYVFKW